MKNLLTTLMFVAAFMAAGMANNIAVSSVSLTDQEPASHYCNITFTISWDNSWRTASAPANWDAAWVFVKYRINGTGNWYHASLSPTPAHHTPVSGSAISPASDGTGVFMYRSANGSGTNSWTGQKIRWNYGLDGVGDDASIEIKLFAIEMVYIPQGAFYIGDGDGTSESLFSFHTGTGNAAVQITATLAGDVQTDVGAADDANLTVVGIGIDGDQGIDPDDNGTIDNPGFPTGFTAFYMMKYEVSQEQYVDFLNSLTRDQQASRVGADISGTAPSFPFVLSMSNAPFSRNGVRCPASIALPPAVITFFCDGNGNGTGNESTDGLTVACNYVSWPDLCAYADWAGLRPATEIEFEKAARGSNPSVYGEYAWGTPNLCTQGYGFSNQGAVSEGLTNLCTGTNGNAIYSTFGLVVRCGAIAASAASKTRVETGAGYYGVMELSGNLWEREVSLGTVAGRSYTGLHGDGELNNAGDATVDYWPGINGNASISVANGPYGGTTGVTAAAGSGRMMSSFNSSPTNWLRISDRSYVNVNNQIRESHFGIRSVRSAP